MTLNHNYDCSNGAVAGIAGNVLFPINNFANPAGGDGIDETTNSRV